MFLSIFISFLLEGERGEILILLLTFVISIMFLMFASKSKQTLSYTCMGRKSRNAQATFSSEYRFIQYKWQGLCWH